MTKPRKFPNCHWVLDWSKINTIQDVISLLKCIDLHPIPHHPNFDGIKHMCKLIDDDGNTIPPDSTLWKMYDND